MKIISLNVGRRTEKYWNNKVVLTSIFKSSVDGKRKVAFTNIEGDEQADLKVHGGVNKAVYAYDLEHYEYWKAILPRDDWQPGMFGENLTTSGLVDNEVRIGSIYQIGTAKLQAIQPRFPCIKINIRFGLPDMIERFSEANRSGIYFKVIEEGFIEAGDEIQLVGLSPHSVTVQEYAECYYTKGENRDLLKSLIAIPFLPERHRMVFESFVEA